MLSIAEGRLDGMIWRQALAFAFLIFLVQPGLSADWPDCKFQCKANEVIVTRLWLGDGQGGDLAGCQARAASDAYIWAEFRNLASKPRYAVILLADIWVDGQMITTFYDEGLCVLEAIPSKATTSVPLYSFPWSCGQEVKLSRLVVSWETATGTSCDSATRECHNRNTKCYGGGNTELIVESPLFADFTASPACPGFPTAFSDRSGGGLAPYSYSWTFGDGSFPSSERDPQHVYDLSGNYTVTLVVTDSAGRSAIYAEEVSISDCSCHIEGPNTTCTTHVDTYTATATMAGVVGYRWMLDGEEVAGSTVNDMQTVDIGWDAYVPGDHILELVAYSQSGEVRCSLTVNVIATPVAKIEFVE